MGKNLILLTNFFPFAKGEEYLESELPILARKFDNIYILACMISEGSNTTRTVPSNVVVIKSGLDHSKVGRISMLINAIPTSVDEKKLRLDRKFYSKYFESRSNLISEQFIKKLNQFEINNNDTFIIYSYWLYITANVALILKEKVPYLNNSRVISRAHRYDLYEDEAPLRFLPKREYLLNNLDKIYPVSEDGKKFLVRKYPKFENKIHVRHLGTINHGEIKKVSLSKLHLISVSGVRKVKRLDLLINALSEINIDFKWTHIGDGPEINAIIKLANSKIPSGKFEFLGSMSNKEVFEYYLEEKPTYFINVSESEGIPVSIMEAMSVGIPVIATNVGGTAEIVNNTNGFLINKGITPTELSVVIKKSFGVSEEYYTEMSNKALNTWNEEYDAEKLYDEFSREILE